MSLASMINIYNYKMVSCGAATILHALKVCGLLCGYGVEREESTSMAGRHPNMRVCVYMRGD